MIRERPVHAPEASPRPAFLAPMLTHLVTALRDELPKGPVRRQALGGLEGGHMGCERPVLVVPPEAGHVRGFPQLSPPGRDGDEGARSQGEGREVVPSKGLGWRGRRDGRVVRRPSLRLLEERERHLAEERGGRLNVDALVLKGHDDRPRGRRLRRRGRKVRVRLQEMHHRLHAARKWETSLHDLT